MLESFWRLVYKVRDELNACWRVVRVYPSTLVWPLLLLALVLGVGVWGVRRAADVDSNSAKTRAASLAATSAGWYQQQVYVALAHVNLLGATVEFNPSYDIVAGLFAGLAPSLREQTPTGFLRRLMLAPSGVIRNVYPVAGNERAIGLDLLNQTVSGIPQRDSGILAAVESRLVTVNGPYPLLDGGVGMGVNKALFVRVAPDRSGGGSGSGSGDDAGTRFGNPDPVNPYCGQPCAYNATTGTKFWGLVGTVMDVSALVSAPESPLRSLEGLRYRYLLEAPAAPKSMRRVAGTREPPREPVHSVINLPNNQWVLYVSPEGGWRPSWYGGLMAAVVVAAVAVSLLFFTVLFSRRRHAIFVSALPPESLLGGAGASSMVRLGQALRRTDTPADMLLSMLSSLLEGRHPDPRDVVLVRMALLRNLDVYQPINLGGDIKGANLDNDVAQALMRQLGAANVADISGRGLPYSAAANAGPPFAGGGGGGTFGGASASALQPSEDTFSPVYRPLTPRVSAPHLATCPDTLSGALALLLSPQLHAPAAAPAATAPPAALLTRPLSPCLTSGREMSPLALDLAAAAAAVAAAPPPPPPPGPGSGDLPASAFCVRREQSGVDLAAGDASLGSGSVAAAVAAAGVRQDATPQPTRLSRLITVFRPSGAGASAGAAQREHERERERERDAHVQCVRSERDGGARGGGGGRIVVTALTDIGSSVEAAAPPDHGGGGAAAAGGGAGSDEVGDQSLGLEGLIDTGAPSPRAPSGDSRRATSVAIVPVIHADGGGINLAAAPGGGGGGGGGVGGLAGRSSSTQGYTLAAALASTGRRAASAAGLMLLPSKSRRCSSRRGSTLALGPLPSGQLPSPPPPCPPSSPPQLPPAPPPPVIEEVEQLLAQADGWQFDTWRLQEVTQGHALSSLAFYLMHREGLISQFRINRLALARLLRTLEAGYRGNPYHNAVHAADVLQTLHVLLHGAQLEVHYVDRLGLLAAYFAAIIHDHAHPGLTNDFLIATADPLAVRYNDRSPLENHHCASAFALMMPAPPLTHHHHHPMHMNHNPAELQHSSQFQGQGQGQGQPNPGDVLAALSPAERNAFRKQVIEMVLATDMKQHFAILSHFNTVHRLSAVSSYTNTNLGGQARPRGSIDVGPVSGATDAAGTNSRTGTGRQPGTLRQLGEGAPRPLDDTERLLSLQVALKVADIGHLGEELNVHIRWLAALEEEFFSQGDRERDLGLPISPLFDRSKQGVSKSQVGFYEFVALPLAHAMASAFPGARPLLDCFIANYNHWRSQEVKQLPQAASVIPSVPSTAPSAPSAQQLAPPPPAAPNGCCQPPQQQQQQPATQRRTQQQLSMQGSGALVDPAGAAGAAAELEGRASGAAAAAAAAAPAAPARRAVISIQLEPSGPPPSDPQAATTADGASHPRSAGPPV